MCGWVEGWMGDGWGKWIDGSTCGQLIGMEGWVSG